MFLVAAAPGSLASVCGQHRAQGVSARNFASWVELLLTATTPPPTRIPWRPRVAVATSGVTGSPG